METDSKYLFIYGTLLNAGNEFGAYLRKHSRVFASGYFNGRLYDMGEYPGAVYNPALSQKVWGDIVLMDNANEVLKLIDQYEGYGPGEQQPYLFIRELVPVATGDALINCWVYLYNLPLDGFVEIVSGRYK